MDSVITHIPLEVLGAIVKCLESDSSSLCALSLCSSLLRNEGQPILFQNVTDLQCFTTHMKFLHTVAASPTRLTLFVHAYRRVEHIYNNEKTFSDDSDDDLDVSSLGMALRNPTRKALKVMHNLQRLEIHPFGDFPSRLDFNDESLPLDPQPSSWILDGTTFSLESFVSGYPMDIIWLVERFLPRQRNLKHMGVYLLHSQTAVERPQDIVSTLCPHLISLSGNWHAIKTFLQPNITAMEWIPGEHDTPRNVIRADVTHLAPAFKHVKALSYGQPHGRNFEYLPPLDFIFDYFKSVTVLELNVATSPWNIDALKQLPMLHTFILSSRWPGDGMSMLSGLPDLERLAEQEVINRFFETIGKSLQCIEVETNTHIDHDARFNRFYKRFMRSQETVQEVSRHEVRRHWGAE